MFIVAEQLCPPLGDPGAVCVCRKGDRQTEAISATSPTPPERNMIALAASAFPWPGNQNPQQGLIYRSTLIRVLLLRANDLRFGARIRGCLNVRNSIPKFLCTIARPMCRAFRWGTPAPLQAGRFNAEDKHLPEEVGCSVVFLTSGQKLTLHKVMLYDEDGIQEVAELRVQAAKSLGGGSLGVGVIGSPSWTLLGEAAAISIIGGLHSNLAQKQAVGMLQTAQRKSEAVAKSGVFVDFAQVTNNQSPHPSIWSASFEFKKRRGSEWRRHVHNGDEFVNVETELGAMSIRWDQVAAYFPPHQSSEKLIAPPEQSPDKLTEPRRLSTGWGQLAGTEAASGVGSSQADFIPPKGPSVNRPETLPVGTTIHGAGGVRLAVLPDGSVLTRSADDTRDISYSSVEAHRMLANLIGAPCPLRKRP
jgi:hypothetical protein